MGPFFGACKSVVNYGLSGIVDLVRRDRDGDLDLGLFVFVESDLPGHFSM